MNDRYLYRAKRTDNGEWVEGCLLVLDDETYRIVTSCLQGNEEHLLQVCAYEVDTSTICQCTGLMDKNGKLIWENDVIEAWSQGRCATGKIKHRIDGTWIMYPAWQNGEMWYLLPNDDGITTVEVIGNIFDNKELLEREDKDENNY